jgi:hypothetical protein
MSDRFHLAILGMVLCLASCSSDRDPTQRSSDNGSWSKIVNGLQARLSIERNGESNGTPIISVWIEFRNPSDASSPLSIDWGKGVHAEYALTDQYNRDFVGDALAYDGFAGPPDRLVIPPRSSLRYSVSKSGAGVGKNLKALIDLGPTATYAVKSSDTNDYFLHCTISAEDLEKEDDSTSWHGVLKIPSIAVVH